MSGLPGLSNQARERRMRAGWSVIRVLPRLALICRPSPSLGNGAAPGYQGDRSKPSWRVPALALTAGTAAVAFPDGARGFNRMRRGGFCSYGKTTGNLRETDAGVLGLTPAGRPFERSPCPGRALDPPALEPGRIGANPNREACHDPSRPPPRPRHPPARRRRGRRPVRPRRPRRALGRSRPVHRRLRGRRRADARCHGDPLQRRRRHRLRARHGPAPPGRHRHGPRRARARPGPRESAPSPGRSSPHRRQRSPSWSNGWKPTTAEAAQNCAPCSGSASTRRSISATSSA